jgi:HPt (histidine-containing phosphotransfer) domain-containing protein
MDNAREPGTRQVATGLDATGKDALKQALDRMWTQFLPTMMERVAILETAAAAFASNRLSTEEQEAAHGAAHKLAGALGTFSLSEGTFLAREAEVICAPDRGQDPAGAARLTEIAARLRTLIESRS